MTRVLRAGGKKDSAFKLGGLPLTALKNSKDSTLIKTSKLQDSSHRGPGEAMSVRLPQRIDR